MTIFGVQIVANAKRTDVTTRSIRHVLSNGTTEVLSAADLPLLATYSFMDTIYKLAADGTSWTTAKVNALTAGVKVTV